MTFGERLMVRALATHLKLQVGGHVWAKKFVYDMAIRAERWGATISGRQADLLRRMVSQHRKDIRAEQLLAEDRYLLSFQHWRQVQTDNARKAKPGALHG